MQWIFLSPHFDDVVFSCGGLIWEESVRGNKVEIWTLCAGDVPSGKLSAFAALHHERWETGRDAVAHRRQEDLLACERVGATSRHFPLPDCIYRQAGVDYLDDQLNHQPQEAFADQHLYVSNAELFGNIHPAELPLVEQLSAWINAAAPQGAEVVCPLAVGGHVDHKLTRAAAQTSGRQLRYYVDFPYILRDFSQIDELNTQAWQSRLFKVTQAGFEAWYESIAAHKSQISTFWEDLSQMRAELQTYLTEIGGIRLWEPVLTDHTFQWV